ncbi:MAG: hypothetical protein QG578_1968 [Thermodesulfobacteriota bacterium]|nr:hypothetical protein [Thermodesulfobacteriota bacterium]
MPGGNGTGPMGMGSMTGRAAGFCAGSEMPGYANAQARRGFGVGYGRGRAFRGCNAGRGFRYMFQATGLPGWMLFAGPADAQYGYQAYDQKNGPDIGMQDLKKKADFLESELDIIKKCLAGMDKVTDK